MSNDEESLEETRTTRYISKKLITKNDRVDTTFKGNKVVSSFIKPNGIAKATINEETGVIEIEKYDSEWCGELNLNVETIDEDDKDYRYVNKYEVQFLDPKVQLPSQKKAYSGMQDNNDIIYLSSEEEDDCDGGYGAISKNLMVNVSGEKLKNSATIVLSDAIGLYKYGAKKVFNGNGRVTIEVSGCSSGETVLKVTAYRLRNTVKGSYTCSVKVDAKQHSWYQVNVHVNFK